MICKKCGLRYADKDFYPLCYICYLKSQKRYKCAIKTLKDSCWYGYNTGISKELVGWSFLAKYPHLRSICNITWIND